MAAPLTTRYRSVVAETVMTLISGQSLLPVEAVWEYRSCDPYAVQVVFGVDDGPGVPWVFGRDLLVEGLTRPAGTGDVQVFPSSDGIRLDLSSPAGRAGLLIDADELASFVADTLVVVPRGAESDHLDLDQEVALLVALAERDTEY